MTYMEYYEKDYAASKKEQKMTKEQIANSNKIIFLERKVNASHLRFDVPRRVMRKRLTKNRTLCRIKFIHPKRGELYFLWVLLSRKAARWYEELLTVDNEICQTFREACIKSGLIQVDNEFKFCMMEAIENLVEGSDLRQLFVSLSVDGGDAKELFNKFLFHLARDFMENDEKLPDDFENLSEKDLNDLILAHPSIFQQLLKDLKKRFKRYCETLENLCLPSLQENHDIMEEINEEMERYDIPKLAKSVNERIKTLKDEQRDIFKYVKGHMDNPKSNPLRLLLLAKAGRGKTYLLQMISDYYRAKRKIVLISAYTGIAAIDYKGGKTIHKQFGFGIHEIVPPNISSFVQKGTAKGKLLEEADLIIIDEVPMCHKHYIAGIDQVLRELTERNAPFGNKNIILSGDFRQTCPIVTVGGSGATISASFLKSSLVWHFKTGFLSEPIRSAGDDEFTNFVDKVGDDEIEKE